MEVDVAVVADGVVSLEIFGEWRQFRDARDGFPGEGSRSIARSQILRVYAVFIVFARDFFILLCAR